MKRICGNGRFAEATLHSMQSPKRSLKLSELARRFGLTHRGDGDTLITGVGTLPDAEAGQISFLSNPAYREHLAHTRASAVILTADDADKCPVSTIICEDPYVGYARIATCFDPVIRAEPGIHESASVDPASDVGSDVHIGAGSVVGPGCEIGDTVEIGPGCVLIANCSVGKGSRLVANVTLCDGVSLGERCIVHPGAVIGADGFGLAFDQDHWVKIPQLGTVRIGNDCEIGANTTIDRGAIGDTVLEDDVRLDNQVQIAHNVHIGAHTAMAGLSGIAGSTRIGRYCMFAGSSGAVGHIRIADRTTVHYRSVISKTITEPGTVWSSALPALPVYKWNRVAAFLKNLDKMGRRVLKLEKAARKTSKDD